MQLFSHSFLNIEIIVKIKFCSCLKMSEFVETFTYCLIIRKSSVEYTSRGGKNQHEKSYQGKECQIILILTNLQK